METNRNQRISECEKENLRRIIAAQQSGANCIYAPDPHKEIADDIRRTIAGLNEQIKEAQNIGLGVEIKESRPYGFSTPNYVVSIKLITEF